MDINTPLKILIGLGAIGGATGVGYAIHQQLSTENIHKKLISDGYEVLGHSDDKWTAILTSYREAIKKSENSHLKFGEFDGAEGREETLKEKCKNALNFSSNDSENYKRIKKWCTVPKTLKNIIEKDHRLLNSNVDDDKVDQNDWDSKINEYNKPDKQNQRFAGLPASDSVTVTVDAAGRKLIKAKCKELETKYHYENDFEDNLKKAKLWCSINK